jgi:hypothetical protein
MKRSWLGILVAAVALAIAALAPSAASAAGTGAVHPGVQTFTNGGQCTANFIFRDGSSTYIGQAAHCASTGGATETNGCDAGTLPLGTPVEVTGASQPGTLAYSSWVTMQANGESDPDTCAYNDLALVRLNAADVPNVDPTVPAWGGPTGLGGSGAMLGDTVYSYGNSSLRLGVTKLSPKQGFVVESAGNGWSRTVYTLTPGIPGDSGSGFLGESGEAIGTLSTVAVAPIPASNGVADLAHELNYAQNQGGMGGLSLVNGERPFNPDLVGAILGA